MESEKMDFRDFVKSQLRIAKIDREHCESFTDPEGMKLFLAAVTHSSADPENNYETLEFSGDGIIKGILCQYIPRRFANLKAGGKKAGEGVYSKIRRYLEQSKILSDFALKLGFWEYVRGNEEVKDRLRKKTLEDVFEAFVGAIAEIVDQRIKEGLGYNYANNYVKASLDSISVEISAENLDDPITRLNELYMAKELPNKLAPLKWGQAIYYFNQLQVPILQSFPSSANTGDLVFSSQERLAFVFDGRNWINVSKAPLIPLKPFPTQVTYDAQGVPLNMQLLWHAVVYGFPDKIGTPLDFKVKETEFLKNPYQYGAKVIGQGLLFKKIDAKKAAASQALEFLRLRDYYKL